MWSENKSHARSSSESCPVGAAELQAPKGLFLLSNSKRIAAEETVQLLHFACGIVRLVERLEPWQFGLDEARERFDRRRDGQLVAGMLARDEFSERGAHVGFFEHALHELREEHRHLADLALDPAAHEQRTEDVGSAAFCMLGGEAAQQSRRGFQPRAAGRAKAAGWRGA